MIAGNTIIEKSDPVLANSIMQTSAIFDSVKPASQQESGIVTTVRQMIDITWLYVTVGSWHLNSAKGDKVKVLARKPKSSVQILSHSLLTRLPHN